MTTRSRQIKEAIGEDECLPEDTSYCRKCMKVKGRKSNFLKTTTPDLDSTNCLSVCTSCVNEMYGKILLSENGNIQKTVLKLCRMLNVRYEESAIESALKHIESSKSNPEKLFGLYRAKLLVIFRTGVNDTNVDLTYQYSNDISIPADESKFQIEEYKNMDELRKFWGKGFEAEEIMILEEKFAEYSQTNSIDTHPERVLLKYICLKEYEIDKALAGGGKSSTATLTKEYQDLLKSANISPSSPSSVSVGKAQETWGMFIKTIEETEPAEYFKNEGLFKDYDNVEKIWNRYIVRSIKNFITGSRDFNVEDIESDYEDETEDQEETVSPLEYKAEE